MPGVSREQPFIGIAGHVIRIETLPEAKLGNGVLTLKLAKVLSESKAVKLVINLLSLFSHEKAA